MCKTEDKLSPTIVRALHIPGVSDQAKQDVHKLYELVDSLSSTASKEYFYDGLDEWSKPIYVFIRDRMYHFGFVNGQKEQNERNPDVRYWMTMFELFSNTTYSPYLKRVMPNYKSSAWERNEAFKAELQDLISRIDERRGVVRMRWPGDW